MGLTSGGNRLSYLRDSRSSSSGGMSLSTGNTFRENLLDAMSVVNLKRSGYFGEQSSHKGKSSVRIVKSSNPARTALEFMNKAAKNYLAFIPIKGKGYRCIMKDGTEIVYRWVSSSKDRSPAVEIFICNLKRVKNQKIHFVKE